MEDNVVLATPGKSRKKGRDPSKWKKSQEKCARHRSPYLPSRPHCKHKKKTFACADLTMQEIRKFHMAFYANTSKTEQDNFILKHTSQNTPQRHRPVKGIRKNAVTISYFIKTKKGMLSICSKTFLSVLGISRFRVQNISKHFLSSGTQFKEKRGGDRKSEKYREKKERVRQFILNLKCVESHYARNKSTRQYMPSDVNIRLLWKVYCKENEDLLVKYDYFRHIFVTDFNISFRSPATDACSECISLKAQIIAATSAEKKAELICKIRVHKLKAKAFYEMLKSPEENTIKLSFDCQKNMVLPRVPDQSAYFSRQLYWYNFTICEGHSRSKQTKDSVTAYTWTENLRGKGSNEITSAVYHKLSQLNPEDTTTCIKLFCDGCPGQNKNVTVMGMLMYWLYSTKSSVKDIYVVFPIVGHSFLPPDRIFGRVEKIVKRKEVILQPSEYREILSEHATVFDIQENFDVFDWKKAIADIVKPPGQWHFQFSCEKRICFKKQRSQGKVVIVVRGEVNYKSDLGVYKSVLKKGKSLGTINPEPLPKVCPIKEKKLKDVDDLLKKHFGVNWRNLPNVDLTFYSNILDNPGVTERDDDENPIDDEMMLLVEENDGLRI